VVNRRKPMPQFTEVITEILRLKGISKGDTTVVSLITDGNGDVLIGGCTTVPSSKTGYAAGGLLIKTNDGTLYQNTGSKTSCTFTLRATGQSGYSAPSGYSAKSGYSGPSGYSAISGYSGYSATSGYSGYSGISGYSH
jgi:hypothetical protein